MTPYQKGAEEEWRNVAGYEGHYEVSNLGRIKSMDRILQNKNGKRCRWKARIMTPGKDKCGYEHLSLNLNGKRQPLQVHRIVATAFIPNPENKPQINHIDCRKANNAASNLEWSTHDENIQHAVKNSLHRRGAENGNAKLTESSVSEMRSKYKTGKFSQADLGREYGIAATTICQILSRKRWGHIE